MCSALVSFISRSLTACIHVATALLPPHGFAPNLDTDFKLLHELPPMTLWRSTASAKPKYRTFATWEEFERVRRVEERNIREHMWANETFEYNIRHGNGPQYTTFDSPLLRQLHRAIVRYNSRDVELDQDED